MPGRMFIGLSPDEKHPAEFRPRRLPDEPKLSVWLVIGAVAVALAVIVVGAMIHYPATIPPGLHDGVCPNGSPPDFRGAPCAPPQVYLVNAIPIAVWCAVAALAATLVLTAPFLVYELKRRTGRL
jgi:CDP-diglyceride synthetase